jgi:hypothetical protein
MIKDLEYKINLFKKELETDDQTVKELLNKKEAYDQYAAKWYNHPWVTGFFFTMFGVVFLPLCRFITKQLGKIYAMIRR